MKNEQDVESILENFLLELEQIPWFENLGQPTPEDDNVIRIHSFKEWNGPEGIGESIQEEHIERWRKDLFEVAQEDTHGLEGHWEHLEAIVFDIVRFKVAYNPKDDLWCGPYAAVWFATKIAALVGCTLIQYGCLPEKSAGSQWNLAEIWHWLQRGHWPCGYYWAESYWQKLPHRSTEFENAFQSGLDDVLQCGCPQQLVVF